MSTMLAIDEQRDWASAATDVLTSASHHYHRSSYLPASTHLKLLSHVQSSHPTAYSTTDSPYSSYCDDQPSPLIPPFHSHASLAPAPAPMPQPLPPPRPHSRLVPGSTGWTDLPPSAIDSICHEPTITAELHSCLSFDPRLLIGQLTIRPSSPAELEPRKRQRIPGLTKQQRKERLKQQHREIDARRRHREQSVVQRMHHVLSAADSTTPAAPLKRRKNETTEDRSNSEEEQDEEGREEEEEERKQGAGRAERRKAERVEKALVLERAVEYMERMQGVLHQLAAHSTTQQRLLRQFAHSRTATACCRTSTAPHSLDCLPPHCYHRIQSHITTRQLSSATFLSASAAMMVVCLVTGAVLDVNERLLRCTGWDRLHLEGRMIMAPYPKQSLASTAPPGSIDWAALRQQQSNRVLVNGPDGCMVPVGYYEQPAVSMALMGRLLAGELRSVTAVWRTAVRSGRAVDVECRSWAGGEVEVMEAGGVMAKRPAWLASVYDLRDTLHESDAYG